MSAALGLYRLQQVDSQIDQIQARLKTIQELLENDLELKAATWRFENSDKSHKDAERALKTAEAEVQKQRVKIEQTEASLYGGRVHNPKELQDLQKDVVSLKKHLETLEERELEAMVTLESTEKELHSATGELERVKSSRGDQSRDLTLEIEVLRKDRERLDSERKAIMGNLESKTVGIYDQLRQTRRGIAVTTLSDSSCAACGTTLTASQQQNARSASQLFYCPTCSRILYATN
ncbi:MAG: C4-type zinc ribbon domain-containing protein [Anaerolineales bacterium]